MGRVAPLTAAPIFQWIPALFYGILPFSKEGAPAHAQGLNPLGGWMIWQKKEWKCKSMVLSGAKGTLKPYQQYGDDLLCVRYRYDDSGMRIKTVEIVVGIAKIK